MSTVDSSGFRQMMRRYPKEVLTAVQGVNKKTAEDMAKHIRRIAPRKSGTLISTVEVKQESGIGYAVYFGGPKTTKSIGKRTYDRVIQIGSGKKTTGAKNKAGGGRVVWDYARLIEWGSKKVKKDPSYVPARRRAKRLYRNRIRAALRKVAKSLA